MTPATYPQYLAPFRHRDDETVLAFIQRDVEFITMGYLIKGHEGIREFYRFFHHHIREQISLRTAVTASDRLYAEPVMRLAALERVDQRALDARALNRFTPAPEGFTVDVDLFLHYDLKEGLSSQIKATTYLPHSGPARHDQEARS